MQTRIQPSMSTRYAGRRNTDARNQPECRMRDGARAWLAVAVPLVASGPFWLLNRLDYFWRDPLRLRASRA
jgi:hypothetical protein